jgi:hypothetical protein
LPDDDAWFPDALFLDALFLDASFLDLGVRAFSRNGASESRERV